MTPASVEPSRLFINRSSCVFFFGDGVPVRSWRARRCCGCVWVKARFEQRGDARTG